MWLTSGPRRLIWWAVPFLVGALMWVGVRGSSRYEAPTFGGPEPYETHRGAVEILQRGTTDMTFHATGYAYFVAASYLLLPDEPSSAIWVQIGLLPLLAFAIAVIAKAVAGELAGRVAWIVAGLYYPFGYYAGTFSSTFLAFAGVTFAVAVAMPLFEAPSWRRSLAAGFFLGVATCARPNIALTGVVLAVCLWVATRSFKDAAVRTAPVAAVSLLMLVLMSVLNPPEPGQLVRGSQAMNRSLLEGTYQFEERWWDWEALNDPQVWARFRENVARLEKESGQPLESPATQQLAKRDALARIKADPMNTVKKILISTVRIWIFVPSHLKSMPVKVAVAVSEAVLLGLAMVGLLQVRRTGR
ncbi:MAG: hypothetical protein K1X64_23310, partial [Myxococcaceae bacterium]|nr:hypothetical protein [Myxococcaceae bacterium]